MRRRVWGLLALSTGDVSMSSTVPWMAGGPPLVPSHGSWGWVTPAPSRLGWAPGRGQVHPMYQDCPRQWSLCGLISLGVSTVQTALSASYSLSPSTQSSVRGPFIWLLGKRYHCSMSWFDFAVYKWQFSSEVPISAHTCLLRAFWTAGIHPSLSGNFCSL